MSFKPIHISPIEVKIRADRNLVFLSITDFEATASGSAICYWRRIGTILDRCPGAVDRRDDALARRPSGQHQSCERRNATKGDRASNHSASPLVGVRVASPLENSHRPS